MATITQQRQEMAAEWKLLTGRPMPLKLRRQPLDWCAAALALLKTGHVKCAGSELKRDTNGAGTLYLMRHYMAQLVRCGLLPLPKG
jgi:hypothetical protein